MKMTVQYVDSVSFTIEVEIPDDTPEGERETAALDAADAKGEDGLTPYRLQAPDGLCHRCAGRYDLSANPTDGEIWESSQ